MDAATVFSRIKSFSSGIGVGSIGMLVALFYQIFLARMMGAEHFGIYTFAFAVVSFIAYILDLGVYEANARYIAQKIGVQESVSGIIKSTFLYSLLMSCVVTFLVYMLTKMVWGNSVYFSSILAFIWFIPALYFFRWSGSVLVGLGKNMNWILIEQVSLYFLLFCLVLPVWHYTGSVELSLKTVGLCYSLCLLVAFVLILRSRAVDLDTKDSFSILTLIHHGLPLNLVALGNRLLNRGDIIIIGSLMAPEFVGVYKAIYTIIAGIKQLVSPINNFSLYFISRQVGKGDVGAVFREYNLAVWASVLVTIPAYCVMAVFYQPIYSLIYGEKYVIDSATVIYLVIAFAVYSCTGPVGSLFNALGKNWFRMFVVVFMGFWNFLLNYILVGDMGIAGAAIATMVSMGLLTGVYTIIVITQSRSYWLPGFILLSLLPLMSIILLSGSAKTLVEMVALESGILFVFMLLMYFSGKRLLFAGTMAASQKGGQG